MKIAAFCDQDTAMGLRLAGIKQTYITNEDEIQQRNQIIESSDLGILLITEEIVEKLGKNLKEFRLRNDIPIIIEIPDKKGRKKDHVDYISLLIKRVHKN